MATTTTRPMTFVEFEKMDDHGLRYELRHGEPVEMPPPVHRHKKAQQRLSRELGHFAGRAGEVVIEMGFRTGERNYRIADIAFVSRELWDSIPEDGYLDRAPGLVVEVLSPSNTAAEMRDKRKLCLENGSREFWIVDPEQREIEVSTPDGRSVIYKAGEQIPLFFAPGKTLAVDGVFTEAS